MRHSVPGLSLLAVLGLTSAVALLVGAALRLPPTDRPDWQQAAWPFPKDAFPPGRAWRNGGLKVYVRVKLGFCGNCDTGVVTDEEVDRVTDIDFVDAGFQPMTSGQPVQFAGLPGRSRLYKISRGAARTAEAIAVSSQCDLVVAVIVGDLESEPSRQSALALLASDEVQTFVHERLPPRPR